MSAMKFQFSIGGLIALNYLAALFFANTISATLFLILFQPLIVLIAGWLLDYAVPKQLVQAARENSKRMNGSHSHRRRQIELEARKNLRRKILLLMALATVLFNYFVLTGELISSQLIDLPTVLPPLVLGVGTIAMFLSVRTIYLDLIRNYSDEIANRHLEYLEQDMALEQECGATNTRSQAAPLELS